jgi:hypothetical protein
MNGLCSACKQPVEVVDFRLGEGIVVVRCPACGKQQRLSLSDASGEGESPTAAVEARPVHPPSAAPPSPTSPARQAPVELAFEAPAGFCPKCIAPRSAEAKSCPSCGLDFSKALSGDVQPSAALRSAFSALSAQWADAAAHARLLHLARDLGELAAAGRLYRIRLAGAPQDGVARASLEATVKMASAPVSVAAIKSAPEGVAESTRRKKLLLVAATLFGPMLLFALIRLLGRVLGRI